MLLESVRSQQRGWLDNLAVMVGFHKDAVAAAAEKARREYDRTRAILLVANLLLLLLISGVLVVSLASGIVGPLKEFTRAIDSVAGGDLEGQGRFRPSKTKSEPSVPISTGWWSSCRPAKTSWNSTVPTWRS